MLGNMLNDLAEAIRRWTEKKGTQSTPQQVADRERQYMELQSIIHQANQQTLADSRPAKTTGEAPSNGSSSVTNFNSHFWSCCLAIFESKNKNIKST